MLTTQYFQEASNVHIPDDVITIVRQYAAVPKASDTSVTQIKTKAIQLFQEVIVPLIQQRSDQGNRTLTWNVEKDKIDVYLIREIMHYSRNECGIKVYPVFHVHEQYFTDCASFCDKLWFWLCCCICLPNKCCDHGATPYSLQFNWS